MANGGRVYPSPSNDQPRFWGNHQPEARCISCHQNSVWLRTPFAMGVQPESGKGYQRRNRSGSYQPGEGNHIPDNHEETAKKGLSCSVGLPDWNRPDGVNAPFLARIDARAFEERVAARPDQANALPANRCTQCHYLGIDAGTGTSNVCGGFLNEFEGTSFSLRLASAPIHRQFWMPPTLGPISSPEQYQALFSRALQAVRWCCENRSDPDFGRICLSDRFTGRGQQRSVFGALATRGACALCPDCQESSVRPSARSSTHSLPWNAE